MGYRQDSWKESDDSSLSPKYPVGIFVTDPGDLGLQCKQISRDKPTSPPSFRVHHPTNSYPLLISIFPINTSSSQQSARSA